MMIRMWLFCNRLPSMTHTHRAPNIAAAGSQTLLSNWLQQAFKYDPRCGYSRLPNMTLVTAAAGSQMSLPIWLQQHAPGTKQALPVSGAGLLQTYRQPHLGAMFGSRLQSYQEPAILEAILLAAAKPHLGAR